MEGLFFNFEDNDIVIQSDGTFKTSDTGSQNCTLLAMSQLCRLTKPEKGAQLGTKLILARDTKSAISLAIKDVEKDGGKDVRIEISNGNLLFKATYES